MLKDFASAIRILSADAVQKANSGHPGMPLGMADIAAVLWHEFLKHNPRNPAWPNRDRFVLSNGHGSMLLYSLLHLTGYNLKIEDLQNFRQLHSRTPGHPEYGCTPGVETSTGPLGQGLANAVGMALAEKILAAHFNRPGFPLIDNYTYAFCGDGCLMEGISHEACSLAGTHMLGRLIVFWDNNGISIDGDVRNWFSDDTPKRFEAYGWHVIRNVDGHNFAAIRKAIAEAQSITGRPSLICCRTTIGFGTLHVCGTSGCHGSALGEAEIDSLRFNLSWKYPPFVIPQEIYDKFSASERGAAKEREWQKLFQNYKKAYPKEAEEFLRRIQGILPTDYNEKATTYINSIADNPTAIATRKASQNVITAFRSILPELLGGSADLTESNLTATKESKSILPNQAGGDYIHYGVREFGMFAMMNGLALYGGFIPYGGTFLVFADYGRSAIRMAAMMGIRVIYILTHDSIGLGEDGPSHQPIEHLSMLRATPNLSLWRPADDFETAVAWQAAIARKNGPTALILSRQKLPPQKLTVSQRNDVARGGYVLVDAEQDNLEAIIIATGSEVALAVEAARKLAEQGRFIRVVAMPSQDVFLKQSEEYQEKVLPKKVTARVAVEAGATMSWYRFIGTQGRVIGIDKYGASAPEKELFALYGFSVDNIIKNVMKTIENV